jgi:hypothetical protein
MKKRRFGRLVFIILAGILCVAFLAGAGGYLAFIKYPSIGAQGADALRKVFGDEAVARLESVVFQAQDSLRRLQYQAGGLPQAPWSAAPVEDLSVQQNARVKNAGAPRDTQPPASQPPETSQPALTLTPAATPGPVASLAPQPTPPPPPPTR